jgi:hypothetical protein
VLAEEDVEVRQGAAMQDVGVEMAVEVEETALQRTERDRQPLLG